MTFVNSSTPLANPTFDYTSRDYPSIYSDLVARIPLYLPEWTSQSPSDFGQVLLQMYAYVGDLLGYYIDRLAGEAFMQTATQPSSILNIAAMLDYVPTLSVGSTVSLLITISASVVGPYTIPEGSQFSTIASAGQPAIVFQTDASTTIAGANSATPAVSGTVVATQGVTQSNEEIGVSDGTINQVYPLLYNPVSAGSFSVSVDLGLGPQQWTYVQTLINSGPADQVFTTFVDANNVFYIVFGDGVNGYVPPLGSPMYCTYQTNVGSLGNVGANTIVSPVSALQGVIAVTNILAAVGGTDAQSLSSIQQQAPLALKTLNRAVTVEDFSTLAIQVAGVEWASAEEVTYQLVNLFISPFGGGNPTSILSGQVLAYIMPLAMANTTVTIQNPTYVPINVTASVVVFQNYGNTTTQQEIATALANLLALSNTGFGFRVTLGLIYSTILGVPGVNYANVTGLNRQVLVTLTSPITNGTPGIVNLLVTELPQAIFAGDTLVLTNLVGAVQSVTVSTGAAAGSVTLFVNSFTASATFPIGSTVQDTTGENDAVLLANEIPTAGTFTINVTGGVVGS